MGLKLRMDVTFVSVAGTTEASILSIRNTAASRREICSWGAARKLMQHLKHIANSYQH
jgi:hypothetical protein